MIKYISLLNLAVFKYSIENDKNYFKTYEDDAKEVFDKFKLIYEEHKGTDAPYINNLKKLIEGYEKYFD